MIGARGVPSVIGGIETHWEELYPTLAQVLTDFQIILLGRRRYLGVPSLMFQGVEVRGLPAPGGTATETLFHTFYALLYARFRLRADIVHLHGIGPGFFTPFARLLGMRVVVTHHAADYERPKWGPVARCFLRMGERLAGRFAERIICVSDALRREFVTRVPRAEPRTVTIRHAVRRPRVEAAARAEILASIGLQDGGYILAVGRLDETKRLGDLLSAHANAAPGTLPLVIVGSGRQAYMKELEALASPGTRFLGFRTGTELAALYSGAALLCHASSMEGFGLVILEALAAGTQVAASDIPPHREFGLPDAFYFPVGDRARLRAILEAVRPRSGDWPPALQIVARHQHANLVAEHAELFRSLGGCVATR